MSLRRTIIKVAGEIDGKMIELSKLLNDVYHSKAYLNWGFQCYERYVRLELGLCYRKGIFLVSLWDTVVDFSLPEEMVERAGWAKMMLLNTVMTKDTALDWVKKAGKLKMCELVKLTDELKGKKARFVKMAFFFTPDRFNEMRSILNRAGSIYNVRSRAETLESILRDWDKKHTEQRKRTLRLAA